MCLLRIELTLPALISAPKTLYPPAIPQEGFSLQSLEGPEVPGGPEPLPTVGTMVVVGRGV